MKAEDYKHVVSANGEPPLAENIILDGNVMPLRNDPENQIRLRGEDICFLFEAGARFDRVLAGQARTREFTRMLKANQAQRALKEITKMYESGTALNSLPIAGSVFVLNDSMDINNDYMLAFDVLTKDDCEPMVPEPQVGEKVLAAPLQAAFRNFDKVKGRVVTTEEYNAGAYPVKDEIFVRENTEGDLLRGDGATIEYLNLFFSQQYEGSRFMGVEAPVAPGEEFVHPSPDAISDYLRGAKCLSGTVWDVDVSIYDYFGQQEQYSKHVITLDQSWIPSENGHFTKLKCSTEESMEILEKICNEINPGLWGVVTRDDTGSPGAWLNSVRAQMKFRIGIAAVYDCLREGFYEQI